MILYVYLYTRGADDVGTSVKLAKTEYIIKTGSFPLSQEWKTILQEIQKAVRAVVWPPGSESFLLYPDKGRGRGEGNGVKPIKNACMSVLEHYGWMTHDRKNPLRVDAVRRLQEDRYFCLEWETGNVSSSHRAINRILLGYMRGVFRGGVLIVPTREMYQYLTDRVGNFVELEPYFEVWRSYTSWDNGVLMVIGVEQDGTSENVPRIAKGTNGRALV